MRDAARATQCKHVLSQRDDVVAQASRFAGWIHSPHEPGVVCRDARRAVIGVITTGNSVRPQELAIPRTPSTSRARRLISGGVAAPPRQLRAVLGHYLRPSMCFMSG